MKDEHELYDFIDQHLKDAASTEGKALPEGVDAQSFAEELAYQQSVKKALLIHRLGKVSETLHKVDQKAQSKAKILKMIMATVAALALGTAAVLYFSPSSKISKTSSKHVQPVITQELSQDKALQNPKTLPQERPAPAPVRPKRAGINTPQYNISTPKDETETSHASPSTHTPIAHKEKEPYTPTEQVTPSENEVNPCKDIKLDAQYNFTNPCIGTASGSIQIEQASGGKAPYAYSIGNKGFQETGTFESLPKGDYQLSIKDAHGCRSNILAQITLIETTCSEAKEQNSVFNPSHEVWEMSNTKTLTGTLELYNSRGVLVYRSNFGKFENIKWSGSSLQGETTPPGVYVYKIQYEDSSVQQGSVTIVY